MLEKYTSNRVPAIACWLTKMERYFQLMKYPTNIWVDVITTHVTDAAQAWLNKVLQAFTPLSKVEHARRKLMEIKMVDNVWTYIQAFCTQMYKVPEMTQEEAFSLFMRGVEPKIREKIGYDVEGNLGRLMAMAEKADV